MWPFHAVEGGLGQPAAVCVVAGTRAGYAASSKRLRPAPCRALPAPAFFPQVEHPLNGGNYFVLPTEAGKSWINEWILRMEFSLAHGEPGPAGGPLPGPVCKSA